MNAQATERRKFHRISAHIPVRYRKLGDPHGISIVGAISRNISSGGIRLRTSEFVSKACRLIMELDIPSSKPVKIISKVAWIRKEPFGEAYDTGNQFLEISTADKKLVSEYLLRVAAAEA